MVHRQFYLFRDKAGATAVVTGPLYEVPTADSEETIQMHRHHYKAIQITKNVANITPSKETNKTPVNQS